MEDAIPKHIVVIPDGNRRWAKEHGVSEMEGHKRGIDRLSSVLDWAKERGVRTLTFWGFSYDNFQRNRNEVDGLMRLFEMKFDEFMKKYGPPKNEIRIRFWGRKELLTPGLCKRIAKLEDDTKKYAEYNLNILLGYGGKQEIVDAVNAVVKDATAGRVGEVDEATFQKYLCMPDLPEPDLIIRTSGEQRLSGVLPWHSGYAELIFSPKLWPDFGKEDFDAALDEFARRKRRFGK